MKRQSLTKNFIFQLAYQALILVIPLILSPYLTRILLDEVLGTYSYINSIAYYFVIAANLGISVHGKRLISCTSSDEIALRRSFWSLFVTHAAISTVIATCYFVIILSFRPAYYSIYLIEGLYVLSALFDITWLFYGLENFSSVVIKNAAVKLIECVLIFVFVKTPADLWIYTLITSLGIFLGQVVMLPQAISLVKPIKITIQDALQHIKPLLLFSVSVIASALYTVFDRTLLGILATTTDVAFYEYSNRIIAIPQTFVGIIGTVMMPRACKLAVDGQIEEQKKYMSYSFYVTAFIGMGTMFGICAIADEFAILYYGEAFAVCGKIMVALSPLAYIVGTGSVLRSQCLIPNGMDKQFNLCIILNAVINLLLSIALIPIYGVYGAVIGTLAAEVFGFIYQILLCKRIIDWKAILTSFLPFFIIGFLMFVVVKVVSFFFEISIVALILKVIIGATSFILMSILYLYFFERELVTICLKSVMAKFRKNNL